MTIRTGTDKQEQGWVNKLYQGGQPDTLVEILLTLDKDLKDHSDEKLNEFSNGPCVKQL